MFQQLLLAAAQRTNAKNDLFASREYNEKPRDRVTSENIESLSPSVLGKEFK